ncbi:hypothetical protein GCM10023162_35470 [Klenkia terrae]
MPEPLVDRVRARLATGTARPDQATVAALVRQESAGLLGDGDVLSAVRAAVDEFAGAGVLEPLLRTPGTTDVLVVGPDQVWVDRGSGLERTAVRFADDEAVRRLAVRLAGGSRPPLLASALLGALLVVGADLLARTVLPVALPVGIVTAVIGAPYLLWLLVRGRRAIT